MKKYILQSIRLTLVLMVLLCIIYPVLIACIGQLSKGEGGGQKIIIDGKTVGYTNIGQVFNRPEYFWGRPSAVEYNASGSAGSNKGPSNPDYLKQVEERIDTILKYHPYLKRTNIPADLITASGSGLDPDISPEAAEIQIRRVAQNRKLDIEDVTALVNKNTEGPLMGLVGPSKVNVLKLNLALNVMAKSM